MKLFAYGSNMLASRLTERGITAEGGEIGVLNHYDIAFNKVSKKNNEQGFANIVPRWDSHVLGRLWEVTAADLKKLDVFEGFPTHYEKTLVPVQVLGTALLHLSVVYVAVSPHPTNLQVSEEYGKLIMEGLKDFDQVYRNKVGSLMGL